jgi:hypothetical protein
MLAVPGDEATAEGADVFDSSVAGAEGVTGDGEEGAGATALAG